jgi:uncharacterized protein YprB with RNaseH-like and TPR domain
MTAAEIADALGGRVVEEGTLLLERAIAGEPLLIGSHDLRSNLRLVYGVGPYLERVLRESGFGTLDALGGHHRFAAEAHRCAEDLRRRDAHALKARGAPLPSLVRLFAPSELLFLDIETMGLHPPDEVLLVGALRYEEGRWILRQVITVELTRQQQLLEQAALLLQGARGCVTYNGACFDIPYLRLSMEFYGLDTGAVEGPFNADLLYEMRRRYKEALPDCRLGTIAEHVLGIQRVDDLPGALVPFEYARFLKTGDVGILSKILDHNREDLVALMELARREVLQGQT